MLYITQRNLMYFPVPQQSVVEGWQAIKKDDTVLGIENLNQSKKVVVIFHGNSRNANSRIFYNDVFKNFHIVINEYPGFGLNSEQALNETNIILNATILLEDLTKHYAKKDILLVGESLGTGVASIMANNFNIPNLILITPYTSLADVAQDRYPYVPAHLLLKDNFDSKKNLQNYEGKSLIIMSEQDRVINVKFAQELFDSMIGNKTAILIKEAGHSNWRRFWTTEQEKLFYGFIENFRSSS